jgi:rhodanese-related sulfurtransferase
MANVKTVTLSEVERTIKDDVGAHVWNVLDDQWFKGDLIPGSRRVPVSEIAGAVQRSSLPKDAPVIVYCAGTSCPSSREAAETLTGLGYTNVAAFEGGVEEWKQAGRATVDAKAADAKEKDTHVA